MSNRSILPTTPTGVHKLINGILYDTIGELAQPQGSQSSAWYVIYDGLSHDSHGSQQGRLVNHLVRFVRNHDVDDKLAEAHKIITEKKLVGRGIDDVVQTPWPAVNTDNEDEVVNWWKDYEPHLSNGSDVHDTTAINFIAEFLKGWDRQDAMKKYMLAVSDIMQANPLKFPVTYDQMARSLFGHISDELANTYRGRIAHLDAEVERPINVFGASVLNYYIYLLNENPELRQGLPDLYTERGELKNQFLFMLDARYALVKSQMLITHFSEIIFGDPAAILTEGHNIPYKNLSVAAAQITAGIYETDKSSIPVQIIPEAV